MKNEIINVSKQLMFCSILLVTNQYLIKYAMDITEIHWIIGKYCFLFSTWLVLGCIALLGLTNIIQLISRYNINIPLEKDIMIPLIASMVKLSGITGLILWL
jgi:hypothetical protein